MSHASQGRTSETSSSSGMDNMFACKFCQKVFDTQSLLTQHLQYTHHSSPKPYECKTCGKCFANSSYLLQHARIHLGLKPYQCRLCNRSFTQLCHLQQHIRTHTGEKPYCCQYVGCTKAFSQLSNLQSHTRSHMTDKPFRCNSCYKCFADERSLQDHIPKHTETKHLKTKICTVCGKSYALETYLARHMAKHETPVCGQLPDVSRGEHRAIDGECNFLPKYSAGKNESEGNMSFGGFLPSRPERDVGALSSLSFIDKNQQGSSSSSGGGSGLYFGSVLSFVNPSSNDDG